MPPEPERLVFVFGSNLAGRHGKGAALEARLCHGAIYGQGEGRQGMSYAIPTKDERLRPLPLLRIGEGARRFIEHALGHPDERFLVTRIGCGLAGFTDGQIAPMFLEAPGNCELPEGCTPWPGPAAVPQTNGDDGASVPDDTDQDPDL
jgi:hypothetical protein